MKRLVRVVVAVTCALVGTLHVEAQFAPAPGTGPGLAETIEAIDSARVTTRILYITAHPDDESSSVLTYLARGLHADVALLSLTRGEGGQNALGPEQAPQLGLIRTQELLAVTRGYGVKLYFTRAKDFGFSKTPEETERVWGDQVLEDMVRVIRTFRPNVVINNWGGVHGGHGHHQAAGLLTPKAVQLAADKSAYASQLSEGLPAWGGTENPVVILDLERGSEKPTGYILPLDDVSPLWGKTWREVGTDAFANHRTQGITAFLSSPFLRRPIALKREDGGALDPVILSNKLASYAQATGCVGDDCKAFGRADAWLETARAQALALEWSKASDSIEKAERLVEDLLPSDVKGPRESNENIRQVARDAQGRIVKAKLLIKGVEVSATANTSDVVLGEHFDVKVSTTCRAQTNCGRAGLLFLPDGTESKQKNVPSESVEDDDLVIGKPLPKQSLWEELQPNPPPALEASLVDRGNLIAGREIYEQYPIEHVDATSTHVERVPIRVVPAYAVAVEPRQAIERLGERREAFDVYLRVHSYATKAGAVTIGVDVPSGWTASAPQEVAFDGAGDRYVKTTVTPPKQVAAGNYEITAYAKRGVDKFATSLTPLPSMPTILWEEPARCVVHAFDIHVPANLRVGYIAAEGEPIPDSLRMLGINVELLDTQALAFRDLSKFDAIVTGNRAYELRSDLPGANQRLLDYVSNGGTLVVQYNTATNWDGHQYAPYPAKIGNPTPRITDENSPVKFLKADEPLLNKPNKIGQDDFKGWVQERGLYFWKEFDAKYTPLLAMNDPGESDLTGGLVYTKYGKGSYIYTGLAFFRQLPEGVPGAYRLFVNLLSASRQ